MEKIKNVLAKFKWEVYLTAIVSIILGALLIIYKAQIVDILCKVVGIAFIVIGLVLSIIYIAKWKESLGSYYLVVGVFAIVIGLILYFKTSIISSILVLIFGLFIILEGMIRLQEAIDGLRLKLKKVWLLLIVSLIDISLGLLVILDPFDNAKLTLVAFTGICLIVDGALDLFSVILFSSKIKRKINEYKNTSVNTKAS